MQPPGEGLDRSAQEEVGTPSSFLQTFEIKTASERELWKMASHLYQTQFILLHSTPETPMSISQQRSENILYLS